MGTPDFAVPPLGYLVQNNYDVLAVYTRVDRPSGRGRAIAASPVKTAALELGLTVKQPQNLKGPETLAEMAALKPDAIVVCAFGQILPRAVLDLPNFGCFNIHPSLLPRHRGAAPMPAAILCGDDYTGVTIMMMDEKLDTGPVLMQAQIPVAGYDSTQSLGDKLSLLSGPLLGETLVRRQRHEIQPRPQNNALATYSKPLRKEEGLVDWTRPAVEIWRHVRAFYPWPGSHTSWQDKKIKIISAEPVSEFGPCEPGKTVPLPGSKDAFGVGTGKGVLAIHIMQMQGKRAVSGLDFARGQRDFIGTVLG